MQQTFPPRGSGIEGRQESAPSETWGHPWQLDPSVWTWKPGRILLGVWPTDNATWKVGIDDDRHIATIAGSRGGKTRTSLIPNLLVYPGSVIVIDPKGELVSATASARAAMGQNVHVLDPFGITGVPTASYNPLADLGEGEHEVAPNAAQLADALIIDAEKETHWTAAARNLVRGITLHLLSTAEIVPTLADLRNALCGDQLALEELFIDMQTSKAFGGIVSRIGSSFLGKFRTSEREFQEILSSAQEQTAPLDDILGSSGASHFSLKDLKRRPTTVYLVLPGTRMATHHRWLRLIIQQAVAAMEAVPTDRGKPPVLCVLEEFAALGHMRSIEVAAGYMAGFGLRLWIVLQDIGQLKALYKNSWETFLGNAGIIQALAVADAGTAEYLSQAMGNAMVLERQGVRVSASAMSNGDIGQREQWRHVRLLEPAELRRHFSRETGRQLILSPGRPPIYLNRM
ncbi:type IV secretory system conjugative DNA transfer family protein [Devosia sp.]|uniref:type IV secretory system conjugative DNA transfer family protein n=1 Tax=Devosia sp. TaxID=1871048 RepID=UPI003A958F9A